MKSNGKLHIRHKTSINHLDVYLNIIIVLTVFILTNQATASQRVCIKSAKVLKVLYGVQATGNGHITRARELGTSLRKAGVQVDFVFSGRQRQDFVFEDHEQVFGSNAKYFTGLTFVTENGKVDNFQTFLKNSRNLSELIKDIRKIDVSSYDLVINDFEPVSAWAAILNKVPIYGIANQYSFNHSKVPASLFMKYLIAPAMRLLTPIPKGKSIGLHFDSFQSLVLPPMLSEIPNLERVKSKVTVNLPHENQANVVQMLTPITSHDFHIYADLKKFEHIELNNLPSHIHLHPTSYENYKNDFYSSEAVIVNSGFGNLSQALAAGIHLLSKPQSGQAEQVANAKALQKLSYAEAFYSLNTKTVRNWLDNIQGQKATKIHYPNVSKILTEWILDGAPEMNHEYIEKIWDDLVVER